MVMPVVAALASMLLAGCATKGALKKAMADQQTALSAERTERTTADNAIQQDVASLRSDQQAMRSELQALRTDLQSMRTEFGAKIVSLENGMQFLLPVNFAFDDASVRQQDEAALGRFAQVAQRYYNGSLITVEGFADPAGSPSYNLNLSRRRAAAVKEYLTTQGINPEQVKTVGYGESRLVQPGAWGNQMGAESNRRVVFVVETKALTPVALVTPEQR
jgi:outer membrane protein OmpA-like peptidoglycan-associated protein